MIKHNSKHVFESSNGKYYYHMAIIDYLQEYNSRKKLEHWFRKNIQSADETLISCVPSEFYAKRFLNFMKTNVFIDDSEAFKKRNSS